MGNMPMFLCDPEVERMKTLCSYKKNCSNSSLFLLQKNNTNKYYEKCKSIRKSAYYIVTNFDFNLVPPERAMIHFYALNNASISVSV